MDLVFRQGTEIANVKIVGKKLFFKKFVSGNLMIQPLSKMKIPLKGIHKKWPDLKELSDGEAREEGIKRLEEHIKNMKNQDEIKDYVIKELESLGGQLVAIVKPGHRPIIPKPKNE